MIECRACPVQGEGELKISGAKSIQQLEEYKELECTGLTLKI